MASQDSSNPPGVPRDTTGTASITFIGTATVLIECEGITVLTDPNFIHRHEKVPLGFGLEATRQTDPAMELHDLPPVDCVVLSHFHGDHFDRIAEQELDKGVLILTTPQAARELAQRGFTNARGLETWQSSDVGKGGGHLTVTALPGNHGPAIVGELLPNVMGSMLEFFSPGGGSTLRMYITGDTLVIEELQEIPRRFGDMDVALVHLGGTRVLGILVTMDDRQGLELLRTVPSQLAIPIHFDDYDVFKSPLADFKQRVRDAGLESRVRYLDRGERFEFDVPFPPPPLPLAERGDSIEYEGESAGVDEPGGPDASR